jgi:hypothetical protein
VPTNTVVFPAGSAPLSYTDLDLSAVVGARSAWVLIGIKATSSTARVVRFRTNGETQTWGSFNVSVETSGGAPYTLVRTSPLGIIEWLSSGTQTVELTVLGYVSNILLGAAQLYNGTLPTGWQTFDASGNVSNIALVMLKSLRLNAVTNRFHIYRPRGDVDDWVLDVDCENINNFMICSPTDMAVRMLTLTDSSGNVDFYADINTTQSRITMDSFAQLGQGFLLPNAGQEIVFPSGLSPTVLTDLDLSPAIGAQAALVFLKAKSVVVDTSVMFRRNGEVISAVAPNAGVQFFRNEHSANVCGLVIVACDEAGLVEWCASTTGSPAQHEITVLGYIPAA